MAAQFGASADFESGMYNSAPTFGGSSYRSSVNAEDALGTKMHEVEEKVESLYRSYKNFIPFASRLFLVMTFFEDGLRMYTGFGDQYSFFTGRSMGWSGHMASVFIVLNMAMQLGGSVSILLGSSKSIDIGVATLAGNVILQQLVYTPLWSWNYFARGLALLGSLAMVMCETTHSGKRSTHFDFAPEVDNKEKAKPYIQLVGRVLVVFMFLTLVQSEMSGLRVLMTCVEFALVLCVAVGFRARMAAFVLVAILFVSNQLLNPFWSANAYHVDYVRYEYFQVMSVIGGLLAVVAMGAGDISVDSKKKR